MKAVLRALAAMPLVVLAACKTATPDEVKKFEADLAKFEADAQPLIDQGVPIIIKLVADARGGLYGAALIDLIDAGNLIASNAVLRADGEELIKDLRALTHDDPTAQQAAVAAHAKLIAPSKK